MEVQINLDRAAIIPIIYPIGVKETLTYTYNDLVSLDDEYEVLIYKSEKDKTPIITITEADANLSRVDNKLIWIVNFESNQVTPNTWFYVIRNTTQDYKEYKGDFIILNK